MNDEYNISVHGQNTFVVIPALDPDYHLTELVTELYFDGFRIVVIDDGSRAECAHIWREIGRKAVVLHHDKNAGKGAALKTGFRYLLACEPNAGFVVTADADGQHTPKDICAVAFAAWRQAGSLFLGSRELEGGNVPLRSRIGNGAMRRLFGLACGVDLPDTQTGLRAFDRSLLLYLSSVPGMGYEYEMNVLLSCARDFIPLRPVKIQTVYLDKHNTASHFHPLRDSLRVAKTLLAFLPRRGRQNRLAGQNHSSAIRRAL